MTKTTHVRSSVSAVFSVIFLIPALIFFLMWTSIGSRSTGITEAEKINLYLNRFPSFIHNVSNIYIVSIICCIISIAFAAKSFSKHLLVLRLLLLLVVLAAVFILLFDVYKLV